jgi:ABC-type multidrug transport system ATPase subunit
MPVLAIRSLRKSFYFGPAHSAQRTEAVAGVDLDVDEGEILGIVGNRGAGKTTLLLCAAGLLRRDGGSIHWYGERFFGGRGLPGLSFVRAVPTYYPFLTVRDVFGCYCRRSRLIAAVTELLGLTDQLATVVGTLDIETLKRVAIAQALVEESRVIFFDGSLDQLGPAAQLAHRAIREAGPPRPSINVTSRHAGVLTPVATRIAVMDAGRLTGSFSASHPDSTFAPLPLVRQIAERMH